MTVLCSGSLVVDLIAPDLPKIGQQGSLIYAPKGIHLTSGGHAANVSINLIQLGVSDVHVASSIGDDFLGGFFQKKLANYGIMFHPQIIQGTTTAKSIALIVKGEDKRFIAELTANARLNPVHIINSLRSIQPQIYYQGTVGGLKYLDPKLNQVLREAHKINCINLVDAIPPIKGWENLWKALPEIDILHLNSQEARSLTKKSNPEQAIKTITGKGTRLAIISNGKQGLIAGTNNTIIKMPAFKVKEIDPTGAGDALCAGIIKALFEHDITFDNLTYLQLDTLKDILMKGQAAGAVCVTRVGATTAVNKENQRTLLQKQGAKLRTQTKVVK
jgi:sugar/nucleoside kinase (ribokinase family)